jgi:hypothetical protein
MTFRQCAGIGTVAVVLFGWAVPIGAVDGVKLISQSNALAGNVTPGDAPGFPVTISVPGSYQLSSDLTVPADATGIEISAFDVTLNLNGWTITGAGGTTGDGIRANFQRATVLNGAVQGMGRHGVLLSTNSRVEKVRALDNGFNGILVGLASIVTGNAAISNGANGIQAVTGSTITGNTAFNNGQNGIVAIGATVIGNTMVANDAVGLSAGATTGYTHNVFADNSGGSVTGGVSLGQNACNGAVC